MLGGLGVGGGIVWVSSGGCRWVGVVTRFSITSKRNEMEIHETSEVATQRFSAK